MISAHESLLRMPTRTVQDLATAMITNNQRRIEAKNVEEDKMFESVAHARQKSMQDMGYCSNLIL